MGNWGARVFFYLYPTNKKELPEENKAGHWMRCVMMICVFVHFSLAFFCLAFVGFWPMIINLLQSANAYSAYLTMRERAIVFYLVLVCVQVVTEFLNLFSSDDSQGDQGSLKTLGAMVCISACAILGYMVGKAYYDFRVIGGIHMKYQHLPENQNPILQEKKGYEDGMAKIGGAVGNYAGDAVERAM